MLGWEGSSSLAISAGRHPQLRTRVLATPVRLKFTLLILVLPTWGQRSVRKSFGGQGAG